MQYFLSSHFPYADFYILWARGVGGSGLSDEGEGKCQDASVLTGYCILLKNNQAAVSYVKKLKGFTILHSQLYQNLTISL